MPSKPTLGLVFFAASDWALSPTHPERAERLLCTRNLIEEYGLLDRDNVAEYPPRMAGDKDTARTHFCVPNIAAQVVEAHRFAAGGTLVLADARMGGEVTRGFALVRPPGHHSMRVVHGNRGFCNVHNEAVMIDYLRQRHGVRKIAVVDTDVHHGDGTQDIFWHDPDVLFISLHQDGRTLYPGTGFADELGGPNALARTLNVPLPPGTGDEGMLFVLEELVLPILADFGPELVVHSAGQDGHYSDLMAMMNVSAQGYARLAERLRADVAVLEGGYALPSALPCANLAILLAMAGLDFSEVREPDYDPERFRMSSTDQSAIQQTIETLRAAWTNPDLVRGRLFPELGGKTHTRQKSIYYDTDGIYEEQQETVRLCDGCAGWVQIVSHARRGYAQPCKVWCITIPWQACEPCAEEAYEQHKRARQNAAGFDAIYLQDKRADRYGAWEAATGQEAVLE
jgi:acetoin utilization deacetylase AcuC-like enzyme